MKSWCGLVALKEDVRINYCKKFTNLYCKIPDVKSCIEADNGVFWERSFFEGFFSPDTHTHYIFVFLVYYCFYSYPLSGNLSLHNCDLLSDTFRLRVCSCSA